MGRITEAGSETTRWGLLLAAMVAIIVLVPAGVDAAGSLVTIVDSNSDAMSSIDEGTGGLRVDLTNDPAHAPYMESGLLFADEGQWSRTFDLLTVPTSLGFVVDAISADLVMPRGQRPISLFVSIDGARFMVPLTFAGKQGPEYHYVVFERLELMADEESVIRVGFKRTSTKGLWGGDFAISGHFVRPMQSWFST